MYVYMYYTRAHTFHIQEILDIYRSDLHLVLEGFVLHTELVVVPCNFLATAHQSLVTFELFYFLYISIN